MTKAAKRMTETAMRVLVCVLVLVGTSVAAQAGSDVTVSTPEAPAITGMSSVNGNILLKWASEPGKTYTIERTTTLGGAPITVATGVQATSSETVVVLIDSADSAFFVIRAEG